MARRASTNDKGSTAAASGPVVSGPFKMRKQAAMAQEEKPLVHVIKQGIRCDTEERGQKTPGGRSRIEIVLDASEGFIPLWAKGTTLRWQFRESSFQSFAQPAAAKAAVENLLGEAVLRWGDAAPVKFSRQDNAWDFEIVVQEADSCNTAGCVLASAFFPDAGRHQLLIYPKMFEQDPEEQIETLIHEIGHVFGLRHFFALISETEWPAQIFGEHKKFSIMNYGADSKLTEDDKADLKRLYQLAWAGQLTEVNGTQIKFVKPFHTIGEPADNIVALPQSQPDVKQRDWPV